MSTMRKRHENKIKNEKKKKKKKKRRKIKDDMVVRKTSYIINASQQDHSQRANYLELNHLSSDLLMREMTRVKSSE